jgi:hypothetical protein
MGNAGSLASAELYDPQKGAWKETGGMSTARVWGTLSVRSNGQAVVAGGYGDGMVLASVEVYKAQTGAWSAGEDLLVARDYHTASVLQDGRILAAGGGGGDGVALAHTELLDAPPVIGCQDGSDCATGFCAGGYCCNEACNGPCETCGGPNPGICKPVTGTPPRDPDACSPYACGGGACLSACTSVDDCAEGFVCDDTQTPARCVAPELLLQEDEGGCSFHAPGRSGAALALLAALGLMRRWNGRAARRARLGTRGRPS